MTRILLHHDITEFFHSFQHSFRSKLYDLPTEKLDLFYSFNKCNIPQNFKVRITFTTIPDSSTLNNDLGGSGTILICFVLFFHGGKFGSLLYDLVFSLIVVSTKAIESDVVIIRWPKQFFTFQLLAKMQIS